MFVLPNKILHLKLVLCGLFIEKMIPSLIELRAHYLVDVLDQQNLTDWYSEFHVPNKEWQLGFNVAFINRHGNTIMNSDSSTTPLEIDAYSVKKIGMYVTTDEVFFLNITDGEGEEGEEASVIWFKRLTNIWQFDRLQTNVSAAIQPKMHFHVPELAMIRQEHWHTIILDHMSSSPDIGLIGFKTPSQRAGQIYSQFYMEVYVRGADRFSIGLMSAFFKFFDGRIQYIHNRTEETLVMRLPPKTTRLAIWYDGTQSIIKLLLLEPFTVLAYETAPMCDYPRVNYSMTTIGLLSVIQPKSPICPSRAEICMQHKLLLKPSQLRLTRAVTLLQGHSVSLLANDIYFECRVPPPIMDNKVEVKLFSLTSKQQTNTVYMMGQNFFIRHGQHEPVHTFALDYPPDLTVLGFYIHNNFVIVFDAVRDINLGVHGEESIFLTMHASTVERSIESLAPPDTQMLGCLETRRHNWVDPKFTQGHRAFLSGNEIVRQNIYQSPRANVRPTHKFCWVSTDKVYEGYFEFSIRGNVQFFVGVGDRYMWITESGRVCSDYHKRSSEILPRTVETIGVSVTNLTLSVMSVPEWKTYFSQSITPDVLKLGYSSTTGGVQLALIKPE